MSPLDPHHLTPPASLNRVRIIDLPGLLAEAGYDDYTLRLSPYGAAALVGMARCAPVLG
jgi:hypothetical protein